MSGRGHLRPWAVLACAVAALGALAQEVDGGTGEVAPLAVSAHADPAQVKLGQPFVYTIQLTHRPDQRYDLATPHALGPFEVLSQSRHREDGPDRSVTTFALRMSLFDLGRKSLPDLTFQVADGSGNHTFVVHGPKIEGLSSLPKDAAKKGAALLDIKPNQQLPIRTWRLLWALAALAALGGLAYAGARYVRKLRDRARLSPPPPPRPLHERTLAALEALRTEAPHTSGRVREFHFRLSEIVRGYLGERFGFEALECTSTELLARARELPFPKFPLGELSEFVHESDLVKFAKGEPDPESCESSLAFAYRLVHLTHPPAVVTADALGPDVPQP